MRIGIDISQTAYEKTGVAHYLTNLVEELVRSGSSHHYVLFFSSFRKKIPSRLLRLDEHNSNVEFKTFKFPLKLLEIIWNRFHIYPIEWFVGDVDIFITSDWVEPPTIDAKKATILYDLIVYKYPHETDVKIVETQKRKLEWVKKESSVVLCISNATKKDAMDLLKINEDKLKVVYGGIK